jgi:polyphenol oxidase
VIRRVFTTRAGGASRGPYAAFNLGGGVGDDPAAVAANRARLATAVGLPAPQVVWMKQVHGIAVRIVDPPGADPAADRPTPPEAMDGIVTTATDLGLAVLVADCVPLLAGDPRSGVIGAAHAGRLGAAAGIDLALLDTMARAGASVAAVEVLMGPAICGRCYEVPAAMRDEVDAALPGSASTTSRGTPGLDLRAGLARRLRARGVAGVVVDPRCTYEDPDLFSHRRSAPTGRLAGLIWRPSET